MRLLKKFTLILFWLTIPISVFGSYLLIPMDETQKNHLKAYGIAYWELSREGGTLEWLLNYKGGSFLFVHSTSIEKECNIRGVSYKIIADVQAAQIRQEIADPEVNMEIVKLEKAPKIAVYSPKNKLPWDDVIIFVLNILIAIPLFIILHQNLINPNWFLNIDRVILYNIK